VPVEVRVSASVGIALYPDDAKTLDELLRAADRAMYVAKDRGKGRCVLWHTAGVSVANKNHT